MSVALILVDVAWIVGSSVAVGATAPRWPAAWVSRDRFPVCRWPGESPQLYRRLGVSRFASRLPEGGASFGGRSKAAMGGSSVADLRQHLAEVRRAEWVHWWSIALSVVIVLFNPLWLTVAFVVAVALGNLPFLLVLRNNRLRIARAVEWRAARA
ncbi:MAG: hypothetical protein U0R65_15200 [Candidatus Nanopelagicales bacterium]